MTIFRYEWKQHLKYILGWTAAMSLCIFVMTPVYYSFLDFAGMDNPLLETLGQSDFFKSVGVSMQMLPQPLGMYSFLTSFFCIAAGIFGLHFGISIHTKECSEGTAEYLFTKPFPRRTIFGAKAAVVCCGSLILGAAYILASFLTLRLFQSGFSLREFFLISLSLELLTLFCAAAGILIGVVFTKNRSPLLSSGIVVFVTYCMTSFSRVTGVRAISYLSPYSYFSASNIAETGFYEWDYFICCIVFMIVFFVAAYQWFLRKDISFKS